MDLRRFARHPIAATALFSWKDLGARRAGNGVTRDICAAGVFVWSDICPPESTQVQTELVLPPLHAEASPLRMKVLGQVVRIEAQPRMGFAVHSQNFILLNGVSEAESPGLNRASGTEFADALPLMETGP
jgi:hypothetical protein